MGCTHTRNTLTYIFFVLGSIAFQFTPDLVLVAIARLLLCSFAVMLIALGFLEWRESGMFYFVAGDADYIQGGSRPNVSSNQTKGVTER